MNKTFALILIFVSSGALCCSRFRSSTIPTSVQSTSVYEQRPVAPASCPVTVPPTTPFTPPGEHDMDAKDNGFWLGTEKLWIALPKSGAVWGWVPHAPGQEHALTAKIFWGSVDFDHRKEHPPQLIVTGRRLDGDAPPLLVNKATNALFVPHCRHADGCLGTYARLLGDHR